MEPLNLQVAKSCLAKHPQLRNQIRRVQVTHEDDKLVVTGKVNSFYLKQMLQEALRPVGVAIVNEVQVEFD